MLQIPVLVFFAALIVPACGIQLSSGLSHEQNHPVALSDEDRTEWNLKRLPNPNATDHLVFETVNSLLQHWPNTRMRNGHNIVPGIVPKGTLLYHGSPENELPPGPEWVATDPEHSYLLCLTVHHEWQEGCWHFTVATTRPLRVVYFDGNSAAKLPSGTLDTQDLLARDELLWPTKEKDRIKGLCKWGKEFGVDGFVRMEMDFEIMLCNFTDGVTLVSSANLESRFVYRRNARFIIPFDVTNAGARHDHFPGETRIKLDLSGFVSYYDTQLVPSLVDIRASQERWDHSIQYVSKEDASAVKSKLEDFLTTPSVSSSGIDWRTLIQVIVERYSGRLEVMRHLLSSAWTDQDEILAAAKNIQSQLRIMLTPFITLSVTPTDVSDNTDLDWTIPIYKHCAMIYTHPMESELHSMTYSEKLILQAVKGTIREICRVVTKMWAAGVYAGVDFSLNTKESPGIVDMTQVWNAWAADLDGLMGWLDWNVWIKCDHECGPEEKCYLPTWPFEYPREERLQRPKPSRPAPESESFDRQQSVMPTRFESQSMVREIFAAQAGGGILIPDWVRPQPRCVRKIEPYNV